MNHSKTLLLLALFVPGWLFAQQQVIHSHWSAQLPPPAASNNLQLQLVFDQWRLSLQLMENQALLKQLSGRQRSSLQQRGARYFSGFVAGEADSWVRLSWLQGAWEGIVHAHGETWLLDRRDRLQSMLLQPQRSDSAQLVYRAEDLEFLQPIDVDGVAISERPTSHTQSISGQNLLEQLSSLLGSDFEAMPFTVVADTEFSNTHGNDSTAVIVSRLNLVDGIYSNQAGVGIQLHELVLLNSNGNLTPTDPLDLLNAYRTFMTNGAGSSIEHPGLAHLMTGKDLNGSVVGIAFVGVLCNQNSGFGVNQNLSSGTTSMLIIAHEMGHNFGAPHDGDPDEACSNPNIFGIMNPSINGSQEFSTCSLEQMADDIAAANCLVAVDETVLIDGFEGAVQAPMLR